jgi:PIN domain nuclease of toxin-antitoxin system
VIVLDTHALIWWVNDNKQLSTLADTTIQKELSDEHGDILISSISAWEIALLVSKNRLILTMDVNEWINTVASIDHVRFAAIDNAVAIQSVQLPGEFHPDPADRIITALARHYSATLVTSDSKIRAYEYVKTIW